MPRRSPASSGSGHDSWETANLNYWAYWAGETRGIERDDTFMGAGLGRWRGLILLDHLTARLGPDADDLALNVHSVWALLMARRNLLEDDPILASSLSSGVSVLLDSAGLAQPVRTEVESIRAALRLAGVKARPKAESGSTRRGVRVTEEPDQAPR
jgi:hypothetical protein